MTVEDILTSNEIDRCGILSPLEVKRYELLFDRITQFQAACRGYLFRKKLSQHRIEELIVRCI